MELTTKIHNEVLAKLYIAPGRLMKLMERIHSLSTPVTTPTQSTPKKRSAKLPELKLIMFNGEADEWTTFWSSFTNNIDSREDLEDSARFSYLLQCVVDEPREMIKGLHITDSNYEVALTVLKDIGMQTHQNRHM